MANKQVDLTEELRHDIPAIIDGINPRFFIAFLKDHDELATRLFAGFRVNQQNLKFAIVRQRIIAEVERDPLFLGLLCGILLESNPELHQCVLFETAKDIRSSLNDMVGKYGPLKVKVALLMDDRHSVNQLAGKIDNSVPADIIEPVSAAQLNVCEENVLPGLSEETNETGKQTDAERESKKKIKQLELQVREFEKALVNQQKEIVRKDDEIREIKARLSDQINMLGKVEKQADRLRRSNEAIEQEKCKLDHELKDARKDIKQLITKITTAKTNETPLKPTVPDWAPVVVAMMRKKDIEGARRFCETLREIQPNLVNAHTILKEIYEKEGNQTGYIDECIWIADCYLSKKQNIQSLQFACSALEVNPEHDNLHLLIRHIIETTDITNAATVDKMKKILLRMKLSNPPAYRKARKTINRLGNKYIKAFDDHPDILHLDKKLDFSHNGSSMQLSLNDIIEAIDTNNGNRVEFIRKALERMKNKHADLYINIIRTLSENDKSYEHVVKYGSNPVVVDGSNVAWHESGGKPRIQNILQLRSELRIKGYFPVMIYIDAALLYQIDRQLQLQKLADSGAILPADSRVDADGLIINTAKKMNCPVVTNDHMTDWDPGNEIAKLRFSISDFGIDIFESRYTR